MKLNKKEIEKAKKIKLIATDIDGVLTDGKITILNTGEEITSWNAYDGFAVTLLKNFAPEIKIAWITGRTSPLVDTRAKAIGIDHLYQQCMDKITAFNEISRKENLPLAEMAFIGDDLVDLAVLKRCGFSVCPKNAPETIRQSVDCVTEAKSGKGVFREVVEAILKSQGLWEKILQKYR